MWSESDRESSAMDRDSAELLAVLVTSSTGHEARPVPVGASFAVQVRVRAEDDGEPGTWTRYDEDDWTWLKDRIGRRAAGPLA